MKICKAIEECDFLYENNVPEKVKIGWCDELGALLKNEYAKTYTCCPLERDENAFLLPQGMEAGRVVRLIADGRETTKRELERGGYLFVPGAQTTQIMPRDGARPIGTLEAILQDTYTPITDSFADETIPGAPYDRMYIDFLIAKCNYYNRDFQGYNQHMNYFNTVLEAFAADFIRRNEPIRSKITGWW